MTQIIATPQEMTLTPGFYAITVTNGGAIPRPGKMALPAILVSTPTLPWYTLLLLAVAALAARPEWLGVVIAPTVEYLVVGVYGVSLDRATSLAYLGGLLILIGGVAVRRALPVRPRQPQPVG